MVLGAIFGGYRAGKTFVWTQYTSTQLLFAFRNFPNRFRPKIWAQKECIDDYIFSIFIKRSERDIVMGPVLKISD